jgi:two-component system heavy metal sensor histidine kinase CusS
MRWRVDPRPLLRRVDVPLSVALAQAITLLTLALLVLLFALSSHEAAEVLEESLEQDLRRVAARLTEGTPVEEEDAGPGVAIRILEGGTERVLVGDWPTHGRLHDDDSASLRLAFSSANDALCDFEGLADGRALQGCVRLAGFVGERREQLAQIGVSFGVGLLGVLVVSVYAARRALAPLRSATDAIERVDERHLEARIPVRGTGDDVDRHAEALNQVLARLEASFARMSAFSADVAHELRTPVNRILNLTDVALLRERPESREEGLDAIRAAAEEMRRLIEDMLLLARGDEGRLPVGRELVCPEEILDGLVELYRPSCEERDVALARTGPSAGAKIATDRALLERAVSNLIDNALRHTPRGGRIEVEVRGGPDALELRVSDSGPGIPEAERERIFDRFVQLDSARQGGAGLGLPIARMIARGLGGELEVAPSALGGAAFALRLPSPGAAGPPSPPLPL